MLSVRCLAVTEQKKIYVYYIVWHKTLALWGRSFRSRVHNIRRHSPLARKLKIQLSGYNMY